jgi:hypothetical protein
MSCSLFTPSRAAPHRGGSAADRRNKPAAVGLEKGQNLRVTRMSRPRWQYETGPESRQCCYKPAGWRAAGRHGAIPQACSSPLGGRCLQGSPTGGSILLAARHQRWMLPHRLIPSPCPVPERQRLSDIEGLTLPLFPEARAIGWADRVTGTWWAMAYIQSTSSRAIATTTWLACFPRAVRRRKRLHSRTCAFQLISWIGLGSVSRRSWRWRLTLAGKA